MGTRVRGVVAQQLEMGTRVRGLVAQQRHRYHMMAAGAPIQRADTQLKIQSVDTILQPFPALSSHA